MYRRCWCTPISGPRSASSGKEKGYPGTPKSKAVKGSMSGTEHVGLREEDRRGLIGRAPIDQEDDSDSAASRDNQASKVEDTK